MRPFERLLHLGSVVVDVVLDVPALPPPGGDVLASASMARAGGGFNVMAAAGRQGLPVRYGGAHGSGPFAALARAALADAGIEVLQPPRAGVDTGFVIAIIDSGGERTFITSMGAEAALTSGDLAAVRSQPGEAVYLSGYGLAYPRSRDALLGWLAGLDQASPVFFDPGPLLASIPAAALDLVLRRTDWLTCSAAEAAVLVPGSSDPVNAVRALARPGGPRRVLVRTGPAGCVLGQAGAAPLTVPGFRVDVVDTNGAGDAHTGVFIAALAQGAAAADAARTANAAAALSVTRRGPATAPAAQELAGFLAAVTPPAPGESGGGGRPR
jgi:sugar/nucleoside kinase (ribokinase family)